VTVMGVFPRGSGAPAPCCLTSGSLTLRSAPLCEAPRSSPAPSPPRLLSVCPIVLCPSLPHLWGSQFLFLVLLFLSQGSPFFSFLASLDLSLCPPCPPSLLSQGNSPSRLRTQRRPPSNTCHPSPFSPPQPLHERSLPTGPPSSLTLGSHAPPAAQRPAPSQQDLAHPRGTRQSVPNFPQKLLGTLRGRGQGRAVPDPPPSSQLPPP